jgi:hypothetical protein
MEGLTIGRMVHCVEPEMVSRLKAETPFGRADWVEEPNPKVGEHRAAVVAGVEDEATGRVTLFIFHPDGPPELRTAIHYSAKWDPGTWHWIERA